MSNTPLNSFLTRLADPKSLAAFEAAPRAFCEQQGLSRDYTEAVLQMRGGLLRVLALGELEKAGLSPRVTDKFPWKPGDVTIGAPEINIYPENTTTTNNFPNIHTIDYNHWPTTSTVEYNEVITTTNIASDPTAQGLALPERIMQAIDAAIAAGARKEFKPGNLVIVGSGIRSIVDFTLGAEAQIRVADRVFYTVADPVTELKIHQLNPNAASLYDLYGNDKPRIQTYRQMVERMMEPLRQGLNVCGVFYGHPGVFAWPTHEAVRQARAEGHRAEMFAGVSADACLFADLGIDPSHVGYQTFEATELLINQRRVDIGSHVVIWQVECVGDGGFNFAGYKRHNFGILIDYLKGFYGEDHPVIIYEASMYAHLRPIIRKFTLSTISKDDLTGICTLYIPPKTAPAVDVSMVNKLGMH